MILPTRVLLDEKAGRKFYVDSQNNPYSDERFRKKVKCGLGHRMYSIGEFMCCEKCDKKVKCKVIPYEETREGAK